MLMNSIDKNISKINMEIIDYNALNTKLENGKLYSIIAFNF